MKNTSAAKSLVCIAVAVTLTTFPSAPAAESQVLVLDRTIVLPGVTGRIDHMDVDVDGQRLFVAALGYDAVEVIDLRSGQRTAELRPASKPQGVRYAPSLRRLFVANGGSGGVVAWADGKVSSVASATALDDADNLRWSFVDSTLVAGYGEALAILDPVSLSTIQRIPLVGHPESFQVERARPRIYVNVPSRGQVAVIDRDAGKVVQTWSLGRASQNFPMSLDETSHRLFVATRGPALVLVYDTSSGRRVAEVPTCGDADDVFFDDRRGQLYVVCGEGVVDVICRKTVDDYESFERIPTAPGARTGLFVPQYSTLFVAVPSRSGRPAEIRAYKTLPATR